MTVITLTTDFGLRNSFVGVMKGVIYGIAPGYALDKNFGSPPKSLSDR